MVAVAQMSDIQRAARRTARIVQVELDPSKLGCSDYPALVGADRYRSKFDLWVRLVHGIEKDVPDEVQEAADFGNLLEPVTMQAFAHRHDLDVGRFVKPATRYPSARPWARYSLDFVALPAWLVECKLMSERRFDAESWGEENGSEEVPERIVVQTTAEIEAMRFDAEHWRTSLRLDPMEIRTAHVAVCVGGQHLRWFVVPYDPELGAMLVEEAERFVRDYVEPKKLPPADGSDGCGAVLARVYPGTTGLVRDASEAEAAAALELGAVKEQINGLYRKKDLLENTLKAAIATDLGLKGDGFTVRWTPQKGRVSWEAVASELAGVVGEEAFAALAGKHQGEGGRMFKLQPQRGKKR